MSQGLFSIFQIAPGTFCVHTISKLTPTSELLHLNAAGGFPEPIYEALSEDRSLIVAIVNQILADPFPNSLHDHILTAVGLELHLKHKKENS